MNPEEELSGTFEEGIEEGRREALSDAIEALEEHADSLDGGGAYLDAIENALDILQGMLDGARS